MGLSIYIYIYTIFIDYTYVYIYIFLMYVLLINGTRRTYVKSLSPVLAYASKSFSMVVNTVGILNE